MGRCRPLGYLIKSCYRSSRHSKCSNSNHTLLPWIVNPLYLLYPPSPQIHTPSPLSPKTMAARMLAATSDHGCAVLGIFLAQGQWVHFISLTSLFLFHFVMLDACCKTSWWEQCRAAPIIAKSSLPVKGYLTLYTVHHVLLFLSFSTAVLSGVLSSLTLCILHTQGAVGCHPVRIIVALLAARLLRSGFQLPTRERYLWIRDFHMCASLCFSFSRITQEPATPANQMPATSPLSFQMGRKPPHSRHRHHYSSSYSIFPPVSHRTSRSPAYWSVCQSVLGHNKHHVKLALARQHKRMLQRLNGRMLRTRHLWAHRLVALQEKRHQAALQRRQPRIHLRITSRQSEYMPISVDVIICTQTPQRRTHVNLLLDFTADPDRPINVQLLKAPCILCVCHSSLLRCNHDDVPQQPYLEVHIRPQLASADRPLSVAFLLVTPNKPYADHITLALSHGSRPQQPVHAHLLITPAAYEWIAPRHQLWITPGDTRTESTGSGPSSQAFSSCPGLQSQIPPSKLADWVPPESVGLHCEAQVSSFCGAHAFCAFFGQPLFSGPTMVTHLRGLPIPPGPNGLIRSDGMFSVPDICRELYYLTSQSVTFAPILEILPSTRYTQAEILATAPPGCDSFLILLPGHYICWKRSPVTAHWYELDSIPFAHTHCARLLHALYIRLSMLTRITRAKLVYVCHPNFDKIYPTHFLSSPPRKWPFLMPRS